MSELDKLREEGRKKRKTKRIIMFSILALILISVVFFQIRGEVKKFKATMDDNSELQSQLNECLNQIVPDDYCKQEEDSDIIKIFKEFINNEDNLFKSFIFFLGIVYLVQIILTGVTDIVEVSLVVFVFFRRIFKRKR
jgi:Na+/H+ antiporter NhaC